VFFGNMVDVTERFVRKYAAMFVFGRCAACVLLPYENQAHQLVTPVEWRDLSSPKRCCSLHTQNGRDGGFEQRRQSRWRTEARCGRNARSASLDRAQRRGPSRRNRFACVSKCSATRQTPPVCAVTVRRGGSERVNCRRYRPWRGAYFALATSW